MTNDIVALIEYYEKEKGIDREKVVAALEYAFISAYRKMVPGADAIETLRAAAPALAGSVDLLICDEGHRLKAAGGSRTQAALLSLRAPRLL
ncbi:MAG: NusA N-terminal domain-containing protein, partial [Verrucomicrobiales bacterium]